MKLKTGWDGDVFYDRNDEKIKRIFHFSIFFFILKSETIAADGIRFSCRSGSGFFRPFPNKMEFVVPKFLKSQEGLWRLSCLVLAGRVSRKGNF